VRTTGGQPVPGALVEVHTYGPAGCGEAPFLAYNSSHADDSGRYRVPEDNPTGMLNGCLRILAHPDGSALSAPVAVTSANYKWVDFRFDGTNYVAIGGTNNDIQI